MILNRMVLAGRLAGCGLALFSGIVFAQEERNCLRAAPAMAVDGDLADWAGHPYAVWGAGVPAEGELSAIFRAGWSAEGIVGAIRVYAPGAGPGPDDVLDFFVDTRPASARMDVYEAGVFHFVVHPAAAVAEAIAVSQLDARLKAVANPEAALSRVAVRSLPQGWSVEFVLPWKLLNMAPPAAGRWLGFSARLSRPGGAGAPSFSIGAASVDSRNALEDTPVAFSPVRLTAAAEAPEFFSYRAEEILVQGEPWLEVEVIAPVESIDLAGRTLVVTGSIVPAKANVPFVRSAGGRFWIACERYPLVASRPEGAVQPVRLALQSEKWTREVPVAIPVTARRREIDRLLSDPAIDALAPPERAMARLLKECANESAALLSSAPDGKKPPQRAFRVVFNPGIYDEKIGLFTKLAAKFIAGKKIGPDFPYQAWCSAIDGAWLPIKVVYPWNYDPARTYPARLVVYGLSRVRTRAQFMENDLIADAQDQYAAYAGDYFSIVLYGRGCSHVRLGDEELDYVFKTLLPGLRIDPRRVAVYGGSYGAAVALELALRRPDRFAWVYSRAGSFGSFLPGEGNPAPDARLQNLAYAPLYLTAGKADTAVAKSNHLFSDALHALGIECVYQERPDAAHYFSPEDPPADIADRRIPDFPKKISFVTTRLANGNSFWLTIDRFGDKGSPAQISGDLGAEGEMAITTKNVAAFSVDFARFPAAQFPLEVVVDGEPVAEIAKKPVVAGGFVMEDERWKRRVANAGEREPLVKRRGLCGPAGEIENARMIVVYGTQDPARTHVLRERAFKIVRERVGTEVDQWGGGHMTFKADVDVTPAERAANNLWLIGGPEENSIARALRDRLPVQMSAQGLALGEEHFEQANLFLSYIQPDPNTGHYIYVEMGRTDLAYAANVLAAPGSDLCIQHVTADGAHFLRALSFDSQWKLPAP